MTRIDSQRIYLKAHCVGSQCPPGQNGKCLHSNSYQAGAVSIGWKAAEYNWEIEYTQGRGGGNQTVYLKAHCVGSQCPPGQDGKYLHSNIPEKGGASWGEKHDKHAWEIEYTDVDARDEHGRMAENQIIYLKSKANGLYLHSNSPDRSMFSMGSKNADYAWEIEYDGEPRSIAMPMAGVLYNVKPARGAEGKMLSTDGENVDLWDKDDESGRQQWLFAELGGDLYHIHPFAGVTEGKMLSTDGENVDLWDKDDESGRQQWRLIPLANGAFSIKYGKKFLSTDGENVDLWDNDDMSGRQQWRLEPEKIKLKEIKFDTENSLLRSKPDFVETLSITNSSELVQESTATFGRRATITSSFSREHGFTFSVEVEKKFSTPSGVESGIKVSMSTTNTWRYDTAESKEDSRIYELPVKVPPRTKIVATATVTMTEMEVPYKAIGISELTSNVIEISGIWTGVSAGGIAYSIEQEQL